MYEEMDFDQGKVRNYMDLRNLRNCIWNDEFVCFEKDPSESKNTYKSDKEWCGLNIDEFWD